MSMEEYCLLSISFSDGRLHYFVAARSLSWIALREALSPTFDFNLETQLPANEVPSASLISQTINIDSCILSFSVVGKPVRIEGWFEDVETSKRRLIAPLKPFTFTDWSETDPLIYSYSRDINQALDSIGSNLRCRDARKSGSFHLFRLGAPFVGDNESPSKNEQLFLS